MMNLEDFQMALQFHVQANQSISVSEFQRAVKVSSGFELDPIIAEVIFKIFDEDGDGHLSFREFIACVKDRLKRGLKVSVISL
jgi:Ca2+-binding EF-hand superfamily protein